MATLAEILALLPDNTGGEIGASDVRTAVTALWNRTDGVDPIEGVLMDTTPPTVTHAPGLLHWDETTGTLEIDGPLGTRLQVGQELHLLVRNTSGSAIANGMPVQITSGGGQRIFVSQSSGNGRTVGMTTTPIANNADGIVTTFGIVNDLNTSAFAEGDFLFVGPGGVLSTATSASFLGVVTVSHVNQGSIFVRPFSFAQPTGTTVARPLTPPVGFFYFDTTLGKPVWFKSPGWVDAAGVAA